MNLEELYQKIGGDYSRAIKVLRIEKLLDKHIRKLPANQIFAALDQAGKDMDATALFENAHAMKGITANLGLVHICDLASVISEEFRPGNPRTMSDDEVRRIIGDINTQFQNAVAAIAEYTSSQDS